MADTLPTAAMGGMGGVSTPGPGPPTPGPGWASCADGGRLWLPVSPHPTAPAVENKSNVNIDRRIFMISPLVNAAVTGSPSGKQFDRPQADEL